MIARDAASASFRARAIAACFARTEPRLVRRFSASEWLAKYRQASHRSNEREVPVLREKINESVKVAMKAQDKLRLSTLRLMNAAIKNADIEAERAGKTLADDELLSLMQKMIKQRQDSIEAYEKGGRKELADQERGEIEVIKGFLPQQMSQVEAKAAIAAVIQDTGAQGMKDMGKVMAALKERHAGKMDFGKASGLVKGLLSGGS
jgi:uncharacterized protein YqeY